MALEDTELKIGGVNLKGMWIAVVLSIATTMAGGIWAVAEFYGRIEKVEAAVQALPDASDKLIELGANLDSIMKNQQQLLDLRDKVSDMETTMAESVLKVNQAAEKVQSIGKLQKEVEDLWRGMDALANPLQ
jgi:predicted  nucleic acid-binding Zn-ribbon protein